MAFYLYLCHNMSRYRSSEPYLDRPARKEPLVALITICTEQHNPHYRKFQVAVTAVPVGFKGRKIVYKKAPDLADIASTVKETVQKTYQPKRLDVDGRGSVLTVTLNGTDWSESIEATIVSLITHFINVDERVDVVRA